MCPFEEFLASIDEINENNRLEMLKEMSDIEITDEDENEFPILSMVSAFRTNEFVGQDIDHLYSKEEILEYIKKESTKNKKAKFNKFKCCVCGKSSCYMHKMIPDKKLPTIIEKVYFCTRHYVMIKKMWNLK